MTTEPTAADLNESAMNHFSRGNGVEAARQLQWALIANPHYAEAWHNRAMILRALNDPFDAILCCDRAIDINPAVAAYHNTKGVCWASLNQLEEARACYDEALENDPELSAAWFNKASAAKLSGLINDAVVYYEKAVSIQPSNHDYHLAYSSALLGAGRLAEGWHEYEHRFLVGDAFHRGMALPEWTGGEHQNPDKRCRGLVLYAEQGYGDAIQFARYASILKDRHGIKVYIEVKKPLVELMRTIDGIDGVIAYGDSLPADATHCLPIMSAARIAGTETIADIPNDVPLFDVPRVSMPYLHCTTDEFRVGICWHAGVRPYQPELREFAERKSIPPQFLQPLAGIKDVTWFSLQLPRGDLPFPMVDRTNDLHDFHDTAKLMRHLDLVISVDTSVAHLAGSLGLDTIMMTPHDNCWRWFGDRIDSPWYPTMTQIRQPAPGDWPSVIERVAGLIEDYRNMRALDGIDGVFAYGDPLPADATHSDRKATA